ncbi:hypothetical protein [Solimonas variicoloris]|uniref:hypothetical protein n=1 Tax=Solimonas variicoloris TaxID=254408 RepID=UPI00036811CB|nr:hypothetical protein [Solimonas variicoloris]
MNRLHPIAALLAGISLGAAASVAQAQMPGGGGGMMSGNAPHMMMRNCRQDDAACLARMKAHRERMEQMHAIVGELKAAKSDKERVRLLQSYVELMDAQMSQMMDMMDQRMQMMEQRMGTPPAPDPRP